jgi:hypothetical protein
LGNIVIKSMLLKTMQGPLVLLGSGDNELAALTMPDTIFGAKLVEDKKQRDTHSDRPFFDQSK